MAQAHHTISLGFTEEPMPAGTHICQIYDDDAEREKSLLAFLLSGVQAGEKSACFSDKTGQAKVGDFLSAYGLSFNALEASGLIGVASGRRRYFQDDVFDPNRMLELLVQFYQAAEFDGCPGCRVIGEMDSMVMDVPGGDRLLEYECRVSNLLKKYPVTAVCQYDARAFDGATIMDVLKVHPMMVVRGAVVRNPFFIPPETFLAEMGAGA